jgi:hypothetical protein
MLLNTNQLNAMLQEILEHTTDGDHRNIAQNYIVQLNTKSLQPHEFETIEEFIDECMAVV